MTDSRPPKHLAHPTLETHVVDLLCALQEMNADAVRELVHPEIEWRNTGLPAVRGSRRVERVLTAVSRLVTGYEVTELPTMTTIGDTVSSRRTEIIRIGWLSLHLDVDGHYTFDHDRSKIWDDRFRYGQLVRGVTFGRRYCTDSPRGPVGTVPPMSSTTKVDCDGCGRTTGGDARLVGDGTADGTPTGWSVESDENYCPGCADTRFRTWGYRPANDPLPDPVRVLSGPESRSTESPNAAVIQSNSKDESIRIGSDSYR